MMAMKAVNKKQISKQKKNRNTFAFKTIFGTKSSKVFQLQKPTRFLKVKILDIQKYHCSLKFWDHNGFWSIAPKWHHTLWHQTSLVEMDQGLMNDLS